jgi:hypothetical protein
LNFPKIDSTSANIKFSNLSLPATLLASVAAEGLLFVDNFEFVEHTKATMALGYTAKVVTETEWRAMTTTDFAS